MHRFSLTVSITVTSETHFQGDFWHLNYLILLLRVQEHEKALIYIEHMLKRLESVLII